MGKRRSCRSRTRMWSHRIRLIFAPLSWPRLSRRIAEERSKSLRHLFLPSRRRAREKEGRNKHYFERAYRVVREVSGPIVLLDDVCTSGAHMIAAHWVLHAPPRRTVALACTFGRSTREQLVTLSEFA